MDIEHKCLEKTLLFQGMEAEEIKTLLHCLRAERRIYPKDALIHHAGEVVQSIGLVLRGSVSKEYNDRWGNRTILGWVEEGQVFAEAYACLPNEPLMVSARAATETQVLFLDVNRVLQVCSMGCDHHHRLIRNLLMISAQKNLSLSRHIFHTSAKSIRGRVLAYLSFQATQQGSRDITIPFNRQQLADYLGVDRSALSGELGKMQREGILTTQRSHFHLEQL